MAEVTGAYSATIRELPTEERPRERLARYGARTLSNQELLAIILRTGMAGRSALTLADQLLHHFHGIRGLAEADIDAVARVPGIGKVKAIQIAACVEIGRRLAVHQGEQMPQFTSPEAVAAMMVPEMRDLKTEEFRALLLDTRARLIRVSTISVGTLDSSLVHPREVFRDAVAASAASIIVVHNHPSGDPSPSAEDRAVTRRLAEAGQLLGIELLDHLVIGDPGWVSLKREGLV